MDIHSTCSSCRHSWFGSYFPPLFSLILPWWWLHSWSGSLQEKENRWLAACDFSSRSLATSTTENVPFLIISAEESPGFCLLSGTGHMFGHELTMWSGGLPSKYKSQEWGMSRRKGSLCHQKEGTQWAAGVSSRIPFLICKIGQSPLPRGSEVCSDASSTIVYTCRAPSSTQGVCALSICPACGPFGEMKPEFNHGSHWTKFLHLFFLDFSVSIPHPGYTGSIYRIQYSSLACIISPLYVFFIRARISSENVKTVPTHGQHPAKKTESLDKACQMGFSAYLIMNHESFLDRWCNHIRE